uniref:Uncharacterized protein n=1 Tax=Florenciella sp. virus SA2 TaxID=3240092 RepID=A0AB39JCJ5_9VIRU
MTKSRIDSMVNHADACSSGNKEAGLVNTSDYSRVPRKVLKTKTTTFLPSALNGYKVDYTKCCSGK